MVKLSFLLNVIYTFYKECQENKRENMQKCVLTCITEKGIFLSMIKKTLTLTKLSDYLGIPKRTLYNMLEDGRFPVDPIKGTVPRLWSVENVDKWVNGSGVK